MWYFSWVLGLGFACTFAILNAMWLESRELKAMLLESREADDRA
jgi:cytochrome bd-I ubiquinol oxidase subunit X